MRRRLTFPAHVSGLLASLGLAAGLAACASHGTGQLSPAEEGPQVIAMGCAESGATAAIGKTASDDVVEKARLDANARVARVLRPGHAYTMEYNGARLNLNTDKNGRIVSVNCG
jgi:hypothetical protein